MAQRYTKFWCLYGKKDSRKIWRGLYSIIINHHASLRTDILMYINIVKTREFLMYIVSHLSWAVSTAFILATWYNRMHSAKCISHAFSAKTVVKTHEATGWCCQTHFGFIAHFVLLSIQKPLTVAIFWDSLPAMWPSYRVTAQSLRNCALKWFPSSWQFSQPGNKPGKKQHAGFTCHLENTCTSS